MKKSDATKQHILSTATDLFFRNGYELTSTKQLSKEMNVSEGLIFKYFGSKKGLLNSVVHESATQFQNESLESLQMLLSSNDTCAIKLKKFVNNRYDFFIHHLKPITIIIQQAQFDEQMRAFLNNLITEHAKKIISNFLADGVHKGEIIKNIDLNIPMELIISLLLEMLFTMINLQHNYDKTLLNQKIELIMKGIQS